jgi:hypothetical protein
MVLEPLWDFGLIEKKSGGELWILKEKDFIRTTKLWQKFISFADEKLKSERPELN